MRTRMMPHVLRIRTLAIATLAVCVVSQVPVKAQLMINSDQPDLSIDAKMTASLVEEIVKALREAYVFPEKAELISQDLQNHLEKMDYDKITSAKELAQTLTDQLQGISNDKHLRVFYSHDVVPRAPKNEGEDLDLPKREETRAKARARRASKNFGFEKVECLEGNVGYISLRGFDPAEMAGETAAAAMNFVADTEALIIDVRKNGGGTPSMVTLLCSYLFDPKPVHLNDLYSRPDDTTHQWWTLPYVPGNRYVDKPVYVLTSERTFSAAEEFAYDLKSLKRATIVGETTGGGAHPGGIRPLDDHFAIFIPSGRAINPVTKTNWEGTGVSPDVVVPADLALKTAHLAALKTLIADSGEQQDPTLEQVVNAPRIERIKQAIETLEHELRDAKHLGK